ncbi:UNVERIFIED_CONTAM: PaaI family thioesterase [Methylobacteriaceae bacterium AG10]|jgi:acyl-coenzyme A thioesterase PaaI-like protein|nr:PaaI family thioesterase [Methylobacteriaceae bacterium AG10]
MTDEERAAFPDGWEAFTDPGFIAHVGPVCHRTVEGRKEFAFRTEEKHGNLLGIVHGGMLLTFADRALSIVVRDAYDGARVVTVEMSSQFVGAAQIGDIVETVPEIVRTTASLAFVRGTLTSGGRPLAAVTGIWKVLRDKPGDRS